MSGARNESAVRIAVRCAEMRAARLMRERCLAETRFIVMKLPSAWGKTEDVMRPVDVRRRTADEIAAAIQALEIQPLTPLVHAPASGAPRCADCHQVIDVESRAGHLSWCPFEGYPDFPMVGG